jgi:hypothetical protein
MSAIGSQSFTDTLTAKDAVISPVFFQPTSYLGTRASPYIIIGPPFVVSPTLPYIQGINRYVFYISYTSLGLGTTITPDSLINNCPVNLLDTFTAGTISNFYSVPVGVSIQGQRIFDACQITPTIVSSSILIQDNFAGTFVFKMVISLTPESG